MAEDKLVTIAEFNNAFDAELAKVALDNEGLKSTIVGDNLNTSIPYSSIYHIQLQVLAADAEQALKILNQKNPLPEEEQ